MATTTKLFTYEEMLDMPAARDVIEEVIDGEIRTMPPTKEPHPEIVENLAHLLQRKLDWNTVRVRTSNFGLVIRIDPVTCRVPDLAVFVRANMVVKDGYVHSPPELVVEVRSPGNSRRDVARLMRDYESLGVPEVWLLSPKPRAIEVLQLEDGKLQSIGVRNTGEIAPKLFPQAVINIEAIWP
ncbi:MAG: Uma2 family endonuclease [Bryobacteraceae bacterium]